jgi:hypothetical protein
VFVSWSHSYSRLIYELLDFIHQFVWHERFQ